MPLNTSVYTDKTAEHLLSQPGGDATLARKKEEDVKIRFFQENFHAMPEWLQNEWALETRLARQDDDSSPPSALQYLDMLLETEPDFMTKTPGLSFPEVNENWGAETITNYHGPNSFLGKLGQAIGAAGMMAGGSMALSGLTAAAFPGANTAAGSAWGTGAGAPGSLSLGNAAAPLTSTAGSVAAPAFTSAGMEGLGASILSGAGAGGGLVGGLQALSALGTGAVAADNVFGGLMSGQQEVDTGVAPVESSVAPVDTGVPMPGEHAVEPGPSLGLDEILNSPAQLSNLFGDFLINNPEGVDVISELITNSDVDLDAFETTVNNLGQVTNPDIVGVTEPTNAPVQTPEPAPQVPEPTTQVPQGPNQIGTGTDPNGTGTNNTGNGVDQTGQGNANGSEIQLPEINITQNPAVVSAPEAPVIIPQWGTAAQGPAAYMQALNPGMAIDHTKFIPPHILNRLGMGILGGNGNGT